MPTAQSYKKMKWEKCGKSNKSYICPNVARYWCSHIYLGTNVNTYSNQNIHRRMCDVLKSETRQVWHADWPTNGRVVALRLFCSLSVDLLKRKFAVANGRWSFWAISPFGSDNRFLFVECGRMTASRLLVTRTAVSYFTPFLLLIEATVECTVKHPNHFLFI